MARRFGEFDSNSVPLNFLNREVQNSDVEADILPPTNIISPPQNLIFGKARPQEPRPNGPRQDEPNLCYYVEDDKTGINNIFPVGLPEACCGPFVQCVPRRPLLDQCSQYYYGVGSPLEGTPRGTLFGHPNVQIFETTRNNFSAIATFDLRSGSDLLVRSGDPLIDSPERLTRSGNLNGFAGATATLLSGAPKIEADTEVNYYYNRLKDIRCATGIRSEFIRLGGRTTVSRISIVQPLNSCSYNVVTRVCRFRRLIIDAFTVSRSPEFEVAFISEGPFTTTTHRCSNILHFSLPDIDGDWTGLSINTDDICCADISTHLEERHPGIRSLLEPDCPSHCRIVCPPQPST